MSIENLYDHTVEVWRPTSGRGQYAELVETFTRVTNPTRSNAAIVPPKLSMQDAGPGEQRSGATEWYLDKGANVDERDVLNVTSGPESPSRWRVLSKSFPRAHHYELVTEPWEGRLPGDEEE